MYTYNCPEPERTKPMQTASSQVISSVPGSKPIFTGNSLNLEISFLDSRYMQGIDRAVEQLLESVRERAVQAAKSDPQWREFVDLITVEWEDGDIVLSLSGDDDEVQRALAVEYGTPDMRPNPLLRKFSIMQDVNHSTELTNSINKEVSFG